MGRTNFRLKKLHWGQS